MKRIGLALLGCVFSVLAFSQAEMDAYRYSQSELSGSARSVAMGGAFGALGGDISALHTNPAGLGVYQTSEVVATVNFMQNRINTNMAGTGMEDKRFTFSLDNIGSVLTFDAGPNGGRINFGFSYNKPFSYNNRYNVNGVGMRSSLSDYIAQITNRYGNGAGLPEDELYDFYGNAPWLSVMGYNTYLINPVYSDNPNENPTYYPNIAMGELVDNTMYVNEWGSIGQYTFSLGGSMLDDRLYLGTSFVIGTIDYHTESYYQEYFYGGKNKGFRLDNYMSTAGAGFNMKLGAIFRPINALRIGLAYHTPTWYSMTDHFYGELYPNNITYVDDQGVHKGEPSYTPDTYDPYSYSDYDFRTPGKWLVSAAGILGKRAIVSVDWEIANYRQMNLDYYGSDWANNYIESDFRTTHTLRAGIELKLLPQWSLRGGAEFRPSPMNVDVKDAVYNGTADIPTAGTIPNFTIDKGSNTYTFGMGYRFKNGFYTDMACALMRYSADYYNFSPLPSYEDMPVAVASTPASLKTYRTKVLLSVGYKF